MMSADTEKKFPWLALEGPLDGFAMLVVACALVAFGFMGGRSSTQRDGGGACPDCEKKTSEITALRSETTVLKLGNRAEYVRGCVDGSTWTSDVWEKTVIGEYGLIESKPGGTK